MSNGEKPSRREILQAGITTAAVATLVGILRAEQPRAEKRPNILLLITDDQRQETLGCYGNKVIQTPHIDSLARHGVAFKNAFATTAICMSSRAVFSRAFTQERTASTISKAPSLRSFLTRATLSF